MRPASFFFHRCLGGPIRKVRKMADLRRRVRDASESSECEENANDTSLSVTECVSCKQQLCKTDSFAAIPDKPVRLRYRLWLEILACYFTHLVSLLTFCGLISQKKPPEGLCSAEAHHGFPYFTQTPLKRIDAESINYLLIQLIPSIISPILYTQPCVKCNRFIIYTTLCSLQQIYYIHNGSNNVVHMQRRSYIHNVV